MTAPGNSPAPDRELTQGRYGVRFDWGPTGAARVLEGESAGALVVVDVLSFTTAVSVAVERGTRVFPYRWRDDSARAYAAERDAALAVGRRAADARTPWSLSPAALRAAPFTPRLVLPSPNGSAIAAAAGPRAVVVAACLRNAGAVARLLAERGFGTRERPVAVVAAGERWPDGTLRPALEDQLGAGAVLAALRDLSPEGASLSPEARAAAACHDGVVDVGGALAECASGRELAAGGFEEDVSVAAETGASEAVPVLRDGAFSAL